MKTFGIIAHLKRPNVERTAQMIIDWLTKQNLEYRVSENLAQALNLSQKALSEAEFFDNLDCILSLGGDGTMLMSIRSSGHRDVPVFGINVGRLGFLTEVLPENLLAALEKLKNDDYEIDERMVLEAAVEGSTDGHYHALNDVVLDHGDSTRLIKLDLYQGEEFVCPYNADGLIVSTPTGSTAYNLAAGGPVMHPHLGAIIASPICPHSLTLRPIIFDDRSRLTIKVASDDIDVRMTVDGQVSCILESGSKVHISKSSHNAKLIRIEPYSFFEILRTKLHWGARPLMASDD
jgi:NAD+ kinase